MKTLALACAFAFFTQGIAATPNFTEDIQSIPAFTGKVKKNKVRLRTEPTLDGHIVNELMKGNLLVIDGKADDFYAVIPPEHLKGYIFRTYVLDGVVEGNHVNVRLEPNMEGVVVEQLDIGEKVNGTISSQNNKWLEVPLPKSTRFFIAEELVENIGGPQLIYTLREKRNEADAKLEEAFIFADRELEKPFLQINTSKITDNFHHVITNFNEYPEHIARAKEGLEKIREEYLEKKIAYLEEQAKRNEEDYNTLSEELEEKIKKKEAKLKSEAPKPRSQNVTPKMQQWIPEEEHYFAMWQKGHGEHEYDEFMEIQKRDAKEIEGVIEAYDRPVKNKPGDYMLVSKTSKLPIAYLYSTEVDLEPYVGQPATFIVAPRSNNNFAYPAYFVFDVQ